MCCSGGTSGHDHRKISAAHDPAGVVLNEAQTSAGRFATGRAAD
jgi:hypothetical protein